MTGKTEERTLRDDEPLIQCAPVPWDEAPDFGRRDTILRALRRLSELHPGPVQIVETGALRNDSPQGRDGDGWSTVAWAWYADCVGGRALAVDCDAGVLEVSRRVASPYASALDLVASDSVAFLSEWHREERGPIHLLYLDSCDWIDRGASEEHNLQEARAALPHLAGTCLVLIDDMRPPDEPDSSGVPVFEGKGRQTVPFLVGEGFRLEWAEGGQALLSRGA